MRLDELVNKNYDRLNENDLMIWKYIKQHKTECCAISIESLAKECCISRTTISRFTQKLSFEGFREFKMHLKLECEADRTAKNIQLDDICSNYIKCIQSTKDIDMEEICEHIAKAEKLFVFGTGEAQNDAAQMIRRMFMYVSRFFIQLSGKSELFIALEDIKADDFILIISLSGENELAIEAARKARSRGAYLLSLTTLSDNTLARLSNKSLYITTNNLVQIGDISLETCGAYYNILEILCMKYILYTNQKK